MTEIEKLFLSNPIDSDVIKGKVVELGIDFLGEQWKNVTKNQVKISENMGGQSNYLYHVTSSVPNVTGFLLRIHRQAQDLVFKDTVPFAILSERKLGPKLYGFFDGGRLEEFLPSRYFFKEDSRNPEFVRKVGSALPKFHSLDMPVPNSDRCFQLMRDWLQGYKDLGGKDYEIYTTTVAYKDHPEKVSIEDLNREIEIFEKWAKEIYEDTLVFGHTDLGDANILELNSTNELIFIDCEFAMYNWRGFDLAMFLSEAAIDFPKEHPGIKINEDLTENPPNLRVLCEAYIDGDNNIKERIPSETERSQEIEKLIDEVLFFFPITHLFWALSSMKHALLKFENGVDLDVQARDRIAVYYHLKKRSEEIYEKVLSKSYS